MATKYSSTTGVSNGFEILKIPARRTPHPRQSPLRGSVLTERKRVSKVTQPVIEYVKDVETQYLPFTIVSKPKTDWSSIMDLIESPNIQRIAADVFGRRPELVARVREASLELHKRFGDKGLRIESLKFDSWDPPLSLSMYADLPFTRYWEEYDAFLDFIIERGWVDDPDLGINTFYDGPEE